MKWRRNAWPWYSAGLLASDVLFFVLTNPKTVAAPLLVVGFLLLTATIYILLKAGLWLGGLYGLPLGGHRQRLALFGTGVIGGLLALQSIGELTGRDVLVLLPLAVLLYVYLSYGRAKART